MRHMEVPDGLICVVGTGASARNILLYPMERQIAMQIQYYYNSNNTTSHIIRIMIDIHHVKKFQTRIDKITYCRNQQRRQFTPEIHLILVSHACHSHYDAAEVSKYCKKT